MAQNCVHLTNFDPFYNTVAVKNIIFRTFWHNLRSTLFEILKINDSATRSSVIMEIQYNIKSITSCGQSGRTYKVQDVSKYFLLRRIIYCFCCVKLLLLNTINKIIFYDLHPTKPGLPNLLGLRERELKTISWIILFRYEIRGLQLKWIFYLHSLFSLCLVARVV